MTDACATGATERALANSRESDTHAKRTCIVRSDASWLLRTSPPYMSSAAVPHPMPAYVVAVIADITDPERYKEYVAGVLATVTAHGGRFIARAPAPELLEGGPAPARAVILEFPDVVAARRWHASAEYAPLKATRQRCSEGTFLLLPGYAPT